MAVRLRIKRGREGEDVVHPAATIACAYTAATEQS